MSGIANAPARSVQIPRAAAIVVAVLVAGLLTALLIWQGLTSAGVPDPTALHTTATAATLDIAVLVFREGLECILVLSAITAGMRGGQTQYREPIAWGALTAAGATIATWFIAVLAIDSLTESIPALDIQAATGLLAIVVLLVVMNWFFHRIYWTGWIGAHNRRKRELLDSTPEERSPRRVLFGLAALGFTSLYREGFEVVLFLQSYRLKVGGGVVLGGVLIGTALAGTIAVFTFVARRKLPYKQMLVITGVLLGGVLLVMVGEQAQEMQLAHWIPTTPIKPLVGRIPDWAGLWFSVFPTVQTMLAQGLAAVLVTGSYVAARARTLRSR